MSWWNPKRGKATPHPSCGSRFWRCRRGVSTVEFALLSPILVLLIAGTVDFGLVLHKKFQLNSAVSSGANYALLRADDLNADNATEIAESIAAILIGSRPNDPYDVEVVVNNAIIATVTLGEAEVAEGEGDVDMCYCPTRQNGKVQWGAAVACGGTCQSGGLAGKFVAITASAAHAPLFGGYGLASDGNVSADTFLQAQ